MKASNLLVSIVTCMASLTAYADPTSPITANQSELSGSVYRDLSKNVLFEGFAPDTFSLQLLQAKNSFHKYDLVFGGSVEADLQQWQGDKILMSPYGIYQSGTGAYLTQATLDIMENFSSWSTLFFSVADSHIGRPAPNGNYIYLPHAAAVLGNLDKLPVYLTLGISSIPFGIFTGSGTWDSPLTASYFSPNQAPQISLGYFKNGWNFAAAGYSDQVNHENLFAYNASYTKSNDTYSYSLGAGYLNDLKSNTTGEPSNQTKQNLDGQDMGAIVEFNASVVYREVGLNGEYLRGNAILQPNTDIPKAFAITATYTPTIAGKDTPFGITYSKTIHLNLIPGTLTGANTLQLAADGLRTNWACSVSRPIFTPNIYLGFDFERSTTYTDHHTYTGTVDLTAFI
ncbi:MAG: LbtU family siderophore porin [Gammaproteobacteria bacterium]